MYKTIVFLILVVSFAMFGCFSEKTYLSEEIKEVNPYQDGQKLTFVSNLGTENILLITELRKSSFPDGMGAYLNERYSVLAFRTSKRVRGGVEKCILKFLAMTDKNEEKISFCISLRDTYLNMNFVNFTDYKNRTLINLTTDYSKFDDVILFKNYPSRKISDNEIVEFYWSKSSGYVRLIQSNGVVWDLKSIE